MPSELEDLVEFLHHGNTQVRQIAVENLVPYSTSQPSIFKRHQLLPINDLKLLIRDYPQIAKNVLTILVNLSGEDGEVRAKLVSDDEFLESLLKRVTDTKEPHADLQCMLLANLSKSPSIPKLLSLQRPVPTPLSTSPFAIDQLLDCFVKGSGGSYNKDANHDYLSYLFADLAKHAAGREYFLTPRKEDEGIVPLSKIIVFTEHGSAIRRRGVANTIKNVCFDVPAHPRLLYSDTDLETPDDVTNPIGLLPYILLPLMGSESFSDEDTEGMLDECQLLPPDKERDNQPDIMATHLESLLLLTTEKESRARLRAVKTYPIVRECHLQVEDEGVREGCDRLVQVLMREEGMKVSEGEGEGGDGEGRVEEVDEDEDEDEQIVDVV
ncbi:Protein hgh1 [Saxophila tyrrhenica]|uniref:Protein HGH1 homolog n=1 Tax=Saxophila tyrrhenica TaxID=1690608 RepID=A0AAV9P8A3_9PEZI|nr:Protein hgh1 [Saxophila tyrrhenica]